LKTAYDHVTTLDSVPLSAIDTLYSKGNISIDVISQEYPDLNPHEKLVVTNCLSSSRSALGIVDRSKEHISIVREQKVWGVSARNKEQNFLMCLLKDDSIRFQLVLGRAGTGKTLLTYASALSQVFEQGSYEKLVLTKPTYEVGAGGGLGAVPGDIDEKFQPFLINFEHIAAELSANKYYQVQHQINFIPIQRMRGASFINTLVIADEVQSLGTHEIRTLCTRIGRGSKLVMMGDLSQRDRRISLEDTGLYKLAVSERIKESPLCAVVELKKNERSSISALLDSVLSKT
jgi:PhoH-like ATPase